MDFQHITLQMLSMIIWWTFHMYLEVLNGKFQHPNTWPCIGKYKFGLSQIVFFWKIEFCVLFVFWNSVLFSAFNWKPPSYAHLPVILSTKGTKLSKRHDDANVDYYKWVYDFRSISWRLSSSKWWNLNKNLNYFQKTWYFSSSVNQLHHKKWWRFQLGFICRQMSFNGRVDRKSELMQFIDTSD